ncbi:MAG: aminoglycoside phosphotransferase family protein [Pseudonocardia sediminis]
MSAAVWSDALPPDEVWLRALGRRTRTTPAILRREALTGGYVSSAVQRVDLDDGRSVVLKAARPEEVAALRAVAVVVGVDRPRMLASGPDWLVQTHHPGPPAPAQGPAPDEIWATLARVHAHWRRNRPRGVPVVDPAWWRRLCETVLTALDGAALTDAAATVRTWATDERVGRALTVLPRTLCHGDAHRGNVLLDPDGPVLIDWGNARVAPAGLDVAVLRAPDPSGPADAEPHPVPDAYTDALAAGLGRADPPELVAVEREWGTFQAHLQYLGFAADHQGPDRVHGMTTVAAAALDRLGPALSALG